MPLDLWTNDRADPNCCINWGRWQKKRENVGIFPKLGTLPPFGNVMFLRRKKLWFILHFLTLGTFIVGGSPMLKTVKMEVGFG